MPGLAPGLVVVAVATVCAVVAQQAAGESREAFVAATVAEDLQGLDPKTRGEKLALLRADEFAFFRGTARIFYSDLRAQMPASRLDLGNLTTWISGDAHVQNFGAFDNGEDTLVYDLNDFDEAFVGDFRFDLWRATISIILACKLNSGGAGGGSNGGDTIDCEGAVSSFTNAYLSQLERFVGNDDELRFEVTRESAYGKLDEFLDDVEKHNSRKKMIKKWTRHAQQGGSRTFDLRLKKLGPVDKDTGQAIREALVGYRQGLATPLRDDAAFFRVKDVAQRLRAGLGSYGTTRYYVLVEGPSEDQYDDVILDVKIEATPRTVIAIDEAEQGVVMDAARIRNAQGARVALGNRALLNHVDPTVGNASVGGASYSVRQRDPFKDTFDLSELTSSTRLRKLSEQWAALLAAAHSRSDNNFDPALVPHSFEALASNAIRGRREEFVNETWQVASAYVTQVETDFAYFRNAFPPPEVALEA